MNDSVSRWVHSVMLAALLLVLSGIVVPSFPRTSMLWIGLVVLVVLGLLSKAALRPGAEGIWQLRVARPRVAVARPSDAAIAAATRSQR